MYCINKITKYNLLACWWYFVLRGYEVIQYKLLNQNSHTAHMGSNR